MKQVSFGQIFSIYLGVFSFLTLTVPKLTTILVLLLAVLMIIGHVKKQVSWKFNTPGLLLMALYLIYLIGVFFAHELANGLKYAEYKLALFVIPLLLSMRPKFELKLQWPVIGLVIGTLVVIGIGIVSSCNCYERHQWLLYCFSSSYISPVHHPSYFSGFLLFATAAAWYGYRKSWKGFRWYTVVPYSLVTLVFYFFCLSLAGILFLGIVLLGLIIYVLYRKAGKWIALIALILAPVLLVLVLGNLPGFKEDVRKTKAGFEEYLTDSQAFLDKRVNDSEIPGNQKRLVMWRITLELIAEHPLGVGTGNVDEYLFARLKKYGFDQLVKDDLNPHNQYLQTALEIGILGLLVLLTFIGSGIYLAIKHRSFLLLLLISGLAFNMLFESMLQRQSGIIFYSFWIPVLILSIFNASKVQSNSN
ncbi:O-Antigen ligase [compost metagenome]